MWKGETRAIRQAEFNKYFQKAFNPKHILPALFFDAYPDLEDEGEAQATIDEVKELVQLTEAMQPFPLEDAEVSATCACNRTLLKYESI